MKIVAQNAGLAKSDTRSLFVGSVATQDLITDADASDLRVTSVIFHDGARNTWHTHTTEQVLVVTDGEGVIATNEGETTMCSGDVILVPAGERHWHGAASGKDMTHLSILLPGQMDVE